MPIAILRIDYECANAHLGTFTEDLIKSGACPIIESRRCSNRKEEENDVGNASRYSRIPAAAAEESLNGFTVSRSRE